MGFKGPENNNVKDLIYTTALSQLMFGSSDADKIFKKLNANVGSMQEKILSKPDAPKALMIMGEASEENSEVMLRKIYGQIHKQQTRLVSDEDLAIVKRDMKKSFVQMFESSFTINDFIGTSLLEGRANTINEYEKIIDEMTPQDLQNAAKKYFDLNKAAITMLHPSQTNVETLNNNYNKSQNISFTGTVKKQAYKLDDVKQYRLPNNYNVVTYNSNLPDIYANYTIKSKSPVIPKNPATFAVLNEILENGTMNKTLEEFSRQAEKAGIIAGIETNIDGIIGTFNCDVKDFDKGNALFRELLDNPRFTQETFDKAVKDIDDRILRSEKSPMDKLKPELNIHIQNRKYGKDLKR